LVFLKQSQLTILLLSILNMRNYILLVVLALSSCIGTDKLDDPKDPAILTNIESVELLVGESTQLEATFYYNMWVAKPDVKLDFISKNVAVATVNAAGLITAVGSGQTEIEISLPAENLTSMIRVNVVSNQDDVASVRVISSRSGIEIGEKSTFTATALNLSGKEIKDLPITWSSSSPSIVAIDAGGIATGIANGTAQITATIEGVRSNPTTIVVGQEARVGDFVSTGGYKAIGTATLKKESNGKITLVLSDNFETSFALGTFVYLANSTSGTAVRSQGLELGEIKTNGTKTYDITAIKSDVKIDTYQYAVILCKPASLTFGYADLK
jgi:hypothetical protein